ncbi:ATP-dependent endonuclease [Patescibacteria group bacterium]
MKISRLHINKYKSITKPFTLNEPGKLHFFIGSNNAGKTNILDAITQLYHDEVIRLSDKETKLSVTFSLRSKSGNILHVEQQSGSKSFTLDKKKVQSEKAEKVLNHHIIRLCATTPISLTKLEEDFNTFKKKYPRVFQAFYSILKKYIPKITLTADLLKSYTVKDDKSIQPFERLGAGFQQVFMILMYLFHPQYTILLLEEPEIHLHPALVKKLLRVIENENRYNQIFLTTHSPLFVRTTNLHRLFRVTKEQGSTKVFSPRLQGQHINYNRLKQELNADNTEMFFADKVLLVEGPSDHLLMRGLIDRFYVGDKDIKVIQTYGKSNIDIYAELLNMFNIPYFVLLDRDALHDTGLQLLQRERKVLFKSSHALTNKLKRQGIYVLPNGSIENNYPRKYQRRRKHKTQNALYAASNISRSEYNSPTMKYLKEVIESI